LPTCCLSSLSKTAYAIADIVPSNLKANLISVATVRALSDVPRNTKVILAWNGDGSSNYTQIVKNGSYIVKRAAGHGEECEFGNTIPTFADIEADFEKATKSTDRHARRVGGKLMHFEAELEDFIAEEIESCSIRSTSSVVFQSMISLRRYPGSMKRGKGYSHASCFNLILRGLSLCSMG
jgi:hypothetical protein